MSSNKQIPSKKVVVQASGGIESTVLLGMAIHEVGRENVYPIAFDTDSIFWHHRDSIAVKRVVTNLQLHQNLFICKMPQVDRLEYVRDETYEDVGFIPGFKMLFNIASMAYAQRVGATRVWIGNMGDNVFPDETDHFLEDCETLYNRTYIYEEKLSPNDTAVRLLAPFKAHNKAQVIEIGATINIDLADTVSCGDERLSGGFNCGVCPWCLKRIAGFDASSVEDTTRYLFGRGVDTNARN